MNKKLHIKIRYNTTVRPQNKGFSQREKRALTRILLSAIFLGLFFIFLAPGCSLYSYYTLKKKSNMLFEENKSLLKKTVELGREIKLLQHDKGYLEKVAREKYGMLKKNEEVYYLSPQAREKGKRKKECPLP
jgi:cell division protein FtsB